MANVLLRQAMNRFVPIALLLPLLLATSVVCAQSAVDERAIIAVASELDTAVDAKDWQSARALFLDEITVELPATEPTDMAADALVGMWRESLHEGKTSFHLRGGEIVTFDGADSAVLRSKAWAWNRLEGIPGNALYEVWGDYRYELDRTEDGWRIRRFAFAPRLEQGNAAVATHRLPVSEEAEPPAEGENAGESATEASNGNDGAADGTGSKGGDAGQPDGG